MPATFSELLLDRLGGVFPLTGGQVGALEAHYRLMARWNRILNLTAVGELEPAVERHYCESVFLAAHLPEGSFSVADVGSGAGFPGIPVAIARPELNVVLIESHQRKGVFLREATRDLKNVRVWSRRVEDITEGFDWTVSRAVAISSIQRTIERLAPNIALLGGEDAPAAWRWKESVRLPWGERRYLWIGSPVSAGD